MENLLDSNERTLVIFEAVCNGLSECLSLVHWDIRHMTEHRNSLAIIEQDNIRAKLVSPQELILNSSSTSGASSSSQSSSPFKHPPAQQARPTPALKNLDHPSLGLYEETATSFRSSKAPSNHKLRTKSNSTTNISSLTSSSNKRLNNQSIEQQEPCGKEDPHHLAGLELLDKRLADSFSQAFNLSDQQKSKLNKQVAVNTRPSIFQVLFGKQSGNLARKKEVSNTQAHNTDLDSSDCERDNKLVIDDINRQIRLAMQYSKQLEAHLLKIEELRARYEMHLKMGLVVKDVARAYVTGTMHASEPGRQQQQQQYVINDYSSIGTHSSQSSSNLSIWSNSSKSKANGQRHRRRPSLAETSYSGVPTNQNANSHRKSSNALNLQQPPLTPSSNTSRNSRTTIKEFIENIDKIETEFESYMGSFLFTIEDIQGFARVCQGDVFEISIRYGESDKFKTRISVLKDSRQKCDNRQTVFKARISDPLAIKAYECKGLGKRILLGHKLCETRDLFTARSQVMTISLNQTGSIKLNLIVTWNPLHLMASQ